MAIAVDATTPAIVTGTSSTATTASFTAPANSLLVALCSSNSGAVTHTVSNSGTALTWTSRVKYAPPESGAFTAAVEIFTAPAATSAARTVTLTSSTGGDFVALKVLVLTGADLAAPAGNTGEGNSTTANLTAAAYTSSVAGSRAVGIASDSLQGGSPTSSDTGFAWDQFLSSSGIAVHKAANTGSSGSAVTLNFNGTGASRQWNWVALEVLPLNTAQSVSPSSIASAEAFGTAQLNFTIIGQGIASVEAFGSAIVTTPQAQTVTPTGIASGEAFGTLTTRLYIGASGIASGEAFGAARLAALIGPTGIPSGEAFGLTNVAIEQFIDPVGIASGQAFGVPLLQLGYPQTIIVEGIESAELVEDPTIRNADRLVLVNPSIQETPVAWDALNIRFGLHRGITIMKDSLGVWRLVRYPAQTEIEIAQRVYLGGRRHVLTVDEAEELIAAGYGAYIILEPDI